MSVPGIRFPRGPAILDPQSVAAMLCRPDLLKWPQGRNPHTVHIERAWPKAEGRELQVEWSFTLGDSAKRYTLFGHRAAEPPDHSSASQATPVITRDGIRMVCTWVSDEKLLIHSPDNDPRMPHLRTCLDGAEMLGSLASFGPKHAVGQDCARNPGVRCRLLGYRAGRRAAIAYEWHRPGGRPWRVVGKTYRKNRGERIARLHDRLARRLAEQLDNHVRVPAVLDYLPPLGMVLFEWHGLSRADECHWNVRRRSAAGIDVLFTLHGLPMDELPSFGVGEERIVLDRWHRGLNSMDPIAAEDSRPLYEMLIERSASMPSVNPCTLHRDYYDQQLLIPRNGPIMVLDLDTMAAGDPAVDVGNFLAHVFLSLVRSGESAGKAVHVLRDLVARYVDAGGRLNDQSLAFYWATAMYRLGAVHVVRTGTSRYARLLWALGMQLMAPASDTGDAPGASTRMAMQEDPSMVIREVTS